MVAWVDLAMDKGSKQEAGQEPEGIAEAGQNKEQALGVLQEPVLIAESGRELAKGTEAKQDAGQGLKVIEEVLQGFVVASEAEVKQQVLAGQQVSSLF